MHRIFLPLYRYLRTHKALRYAILAVSFLVFLFFSLQIRLEEDVIKLLPQSGLKQNEVAFSDIGLVDKLFIQITSADPGKPVDPYTLGEYIDEFSQNLLARDTAGKYYTGILHSLDLEVGLNAMDYGFEHLPSFVDTSVYEALAAALEPDAIRAQMERNVELIAEDMTGTVTQMVCSDPFNLREALLGDLLSGEGMAGGYNIVDGHFFSPDTTVVMAFLSPTFHHTNSGMATPFNRILSKERKSFEAAHPDIRVLAHGAPLSGYSNASTIKMDLLRTVGISLLIILVILLLCFHRLSFIRHMVMPVAYGTVFSLACIYWIKGYMSLMAFGCGAIILGVALSYCLHLLIHYYYVEDIEKVIEEESTPIFLGCLTTIGAFLGLLFTDSDMLKDFGLFATFLLVGSTAYALVFLPHNMKKSDIKFRKSKGFPVIQKFNDLPWDTSPVILGLLAVVMVAGVVMSPKVKFDSDLRNLGYDNENVRESARLYSEKNEDGYKHLYYAAYDYDIDQALEYNKALMASLDSLKKTGLVKNYSSIVPLLFQNTRDQQLRIEAWKAFWTQQRIAEARTNLNRECRRTGLDASLFEPFFALVEADYEPGSLLEAGFIPEELLLNFIEVQPEGRTFVFTTVTFEPEDMDAVSDNLVRNPHVMVLEPFYYCRDIVQVVHDDFNTTLLISSLFVLIVLLIAFRNILVALVAFLPMFLSWYVLQGLMAIFGLEFNMINIVISTFVFGIGVDYSIFVMEGLLQQARTGDADKLEFHKVAIFFSALVLVITVSSLIFATHPAISSIGMITLIGMISTIWMAYSLEPFIFRLLLKTKFFRNSLKIKS